MTELAEHYPELDRPSEGRMRFIDDAQAMLDEIGAALAEEGVRWHVRLAGPNMAPPGWAGDITGYYDIGARKIALVISHHPDNLMTRPDGVAVFFRRRAIKGARGVPQRRDKNMEYARSHTRAGLIDQARQMLNLPDPGWARVRQGASTG